MSRPLSSNNDLYHLYPNRNYVSLSTKISSSSYQKPPAYGFNSPKNETSKNIFSTKLVNDSHKYLSKTEKPETGLDRKNSKSNNENTPKASSYSNSNNPYANSPRLNQKIKLLEDKRIPTEKTKSSAFDIYAPSSKYGVSQTPKVSESLNLRDTNKQENNHTSSSQTRPKKLEINTEYTTNAVRMPESTAKSYTTKHKDTSDKIPQNESFKKNVVSQYSFEFVSKFSRQNSGKSSNTSTAGHPNKSSSSKTTTLLNRYQPYTIAEKSNSKRFQTETHYGGSSKPGSPKMNNFFNNTTSFESGSLGKHATNSYSKGFNATQKISNNDNSRNESTNASTVSKSIELNKKMFSKTQTDLKPHLKSLDMDEANGHYNNEAKRQNDSKNNTMTSSNKDSSATKNSLQSFVTKVNKGDMMGSIPKKQASSNSNDTDEHANVSPATHSKKPYLMLDETKYNNNNTSTASRTPKSNTTLSYKGYSQNTSGSRTTTNQDAKTFSFHKQNSSSNNNDQKRPLSSQNKHYAKPSTPSNKNQQQNQPTTYQQVQQQKKEAQQVRQQAINDSKQNQMMAVSQPKVEEKKPSYIYYVTDLEKHHKTFNDQDYFCQIYREHFMQTYQAMMFCRYLKNVDPKVLAQKRAFLQKRETCKDKKTLVFDLDETLIHCNESLDLPCDVKLPIKFPHGEIIEAGINIRPYVHECLKELAPYYEIIVFTASHGCYANVVLDHLDPNKQYIAHRLFRESCVTTEEGIYIKDLRVLANRNMQDIVIVDNAAYSFGYQIENGIPIIPFYDNKTDQELRHLVPYLKFLAGVKDLREINKQTFRLHEYANYDAPDKVLNKLVYQKR